MRIRKTDRLSYLYNMVSRTSTLAIYAIMATLLLQLANGEALLGVGSSTIIDTIVESSTAPIFPKFTTILSITNDQKNAESSVRNDVITTNATKSHSVIVKKISTNNELWDALINDCLRKPTMSCFQKNVYSYLDGALAMQDINVTGSFKFLQNKVDPYKYTKEANDQDEIENDIPDEDEARSGMSTPSAVLLWVLVCICAQYICLIHTLYSRMYL